MTAASTFTAPPTSAADADEQQMGRWSHRPGPGGGGPRAAARACPPRHLDGEPDGPRSYAATAWAVRGVVPA